MILAGGRSERMGRSKVWLDLDGVPLLTHVVNRTRPACEILVVVGSREQDLPALPPGTLRVDDPPERGHEGPLSGILTGLDALISTGARLAYLGAVDMPFSNPEHVTFILDALAQGPHAAVVPETRVAGDGPSIVHGLAGAVRVDLARDQARALLHAGRRSVHALYESLDARRIPVADLPDPRVVRACNTPHDFDRARRELAP